MSNYCIEKEYEFIPECDKDVVFKLKSLTTSQRDECIQRRFVNGEPEMVINRTKLFKYGVDSIENLTVNKNPIKTAVEFLEYDFKDLYEEVITKIILNTTVKDSKN